MSFEKIISEFKGKNYAPVYLLHGEEPFFIDQIASYIEHHCLEESEQEFNQTVLYGKDIDLLALISMAKRYPMMAERQVIIVREAQEIRNLFKKDENESSGKNPLLDYMTSPQRSTVLVLCYKYKTADSRTKLVKAIARNGVVFKSDKLYDDKIPSWIADYTLKAGAKITGNAAILLAEHIGNDLSRIAREVDKLCINLGNKNTIDEDMIEMYVGISKEYNVFELQKALGRKDVLAANRIINYFAANQRNNPMVMVLAVLHGYFVRLMKYHTSGLKDSKSLSESLGVNPYFLKDYATAARYYSPKKLVAIFNDLAEYDLRSKGLNSEATEDGELMKELIFKIMH
ncbi:MAG: DNA polymerase III subunit delta [Bacteroidia bacterium]|nr:DNA polymerase III subunit delta [Bacteroidia bacterium]MCZ2278046.1 DNA polymerase III subunit delta [Bacteroidia bacterium]